ncbi:MAG: 23S rRNA (uracil(1939)-C(5))-methyltransferase RlmD [Clostridia bacterium]|nr:23S rRNA (uracil(1939)-C(5))-methyltransferase RlmD [Clostridia bacterium]
MRSHNLKKDDILTVRINEINNLGCGVGLHDESGVVVFVSGAVTGELVKVKIIKANKSYCVAKLIDIVEISRYREDGFCSMPSSCGGCTYRNINRDHELELKKSYVKHAFIKAGLDDVSIGDIIYDSRRSSYRNKAQYPVGKGKNGVIAGFFAPKTHKIIPCSNCALQPDIFSEILNLFCKFTDEKNISVYDEVSGNGLIRHLYLRMGEVTGEIMVCIVINGDTLPFSDVFTKIMTSTFPMIKSIMLNVNKRNTNVVLGDTYYTLFGKPYITDILCGKKFRISPGSFYQVNRRGAELLYNKAAELASFKGNETVLDLYCGIGTIGLSMADKVKEIIGIEIVPEAVECAKENAALNGIENAEFYCGDASSAEKLLENAKEARMGLLNPDAVILDPPRKGSTPELLNYIAGIGVPKIIYISCDPDTLARDCVILKDLGYNIGVVTPVDMFPATGHVECCVLLCREN